MTDYIKLEAVLNRIPRFIRDQESTGNLLSYALDIFKELNIPQKYQSNICFLEVKNHNVKIPDDVKIINMVTYSCDYEYDCEDLLRCVDEPKCQTCESPISDSCECTKCGEAYDFISRSNCICKPLINYSLFLESDFYHNKFTPLKYVGTGSTICSKYPKFGYCQYTFQISPTRVLWTDLREGIICIDYDAEVTVDGNIMIPNHPKLIRAMAAYAEAMYWKNKVPVHEENSENIYQSRLSEAEILLKSAKGNLLLQAANADNIRKRVFVGDSTFRIIKAPEFYYNAQRQVYDNSSWSW